MAFESEMELVTYLGTFHRQTHKEPRESPLSGEWADEVTPGKLVELARRHGFEPPADELEFGEWMQELCDAFESGYFA